MITNYISRDGEHAPQLTLSFKNRLVSKNVSYSAFDKEYCEANRRQRC